MALERANEVVDKVVEALKNMGAVTLEQMAVLVFDGDRDQCYKVLRGLEASRLVVLRKNPDDARSKYAVLSKNGLRAVGSADAAPVRSERADELLRSNEVYLRLVSEGVPKALLVPRSEALCRIGLGPRESPACWLLDSKPLPHVLYVRKRRQRGYLERAVNRVSADKVKGHAVFYFDRETFKDDLRHFVGNSPASTLYLVRMSGDSGDVETFVRAIRNPDAWLEDVGEKLSVLSPGGRLAEAPAGCPVDWAWEKGGRRTLLGDLRAFDVGLASRLKGLVPSDMRYLGWGSHVVLYVRDEPQARLWASLFGFRPWLWFLAEDASPGKSVYRSKEGTLTRYVPEHLNGGEFRAAL